MDGTERAAARVAAGAKLCSVAECGRPITRQSKTGMCKPCATHASRRDPEKEARRIAGLRRALSTPEYRAKKKVERARFERERKDDPAWQDAKRVSGQRLRAQYDADPAAQAANLARRASVGRQLSARRLAWCPPERVDEYRALRKRLGDACAARQQIEASMTPFERQLARVRGGAKLVAKFVPPRADPTFTLGGVSAGML